MKQLGWLLDGWVWLSLVRGRIWLYGKSIGIDVGQIRGHRYGCHYLAMTCLFRSKWVGRSRRIQLARVWNVYIGTTTRTHSLGNFRKILSLCPAADERRIKGAFQGLSFVFVNWLQTGLNKQLLHCKGEGCLWETNLNCEIKIIST